MPKTMMDRLQLPNIRISLPVIVLVGIVLFVGSTYVSHTVGPGDNYAIYKYLSVVKNRTGQYPYVGDGLGHLLDPSFFDYTPMNALTYRAIFSAPEPIQQQVYLLYEITVLTIGLFALRSLCALRDLPPDMFASAIGFFLLNPLVYRMLGADDKTGLFTWPLLCLCAVRANTYAGAVSLGIFSGWSGLGAAAIPLLPALARTPRWKALLLPAMAALIFVVMLLMGGADSLIALHNRSAREHLMPFQVSIWRWVPGFLWPGARYPAVIGFMALFSYLAWRQRLTFAKALIAVTSAYLLLSNNTVPSRVLFFVPLLPVFFTNARRRIAYLVYASCALAAAQGLRRLTPGFNPDATIGVALCNSVLVIPLAVAVHAAFRPRPA